MQNLELREKIEQLHQLHRNALGIVRTWKMLNQQNIVCGKHRVARLRKDAGLVVRRVAKFRVMHKHQNTAPPAPDLLKRAFNVTAPNRVWVGDITSILTGEGWLHLAVVLDLFARRIVGWAMDERQPASLPSKALQNAIEQRRPAPGLICHTDQGAVYSANEYKAVLDSFEARQSMSRRGNCHDNAVVESFFSTLKNELTHHTTYATRAEAVAAVSDYIELYYNRVRPHTTLRYRSPMQLEIEAAVT